MSGQPFRDAEAWLAEQGVEREPIDVTAQPDGDDPPPSLTDLAAAAAPLDAAVVPGAASDAPAPSAREVTRLAAQAARDAAQREADATAHPDPATPRLEDDVLDALTFIRRSTASAPQSEGRLRDKLARRGTPPAAIEAALDRARREGAVDDEAMVAALTDERRAQGHAPARIRDDLRQRGFPAALIEAELARFSDEDLEAAAFALAVERAARFTAVPTEDAFRRVAGYLARRGYPEGLARKAARQAVFASREPQRSAER